MKRFTCLALIVTLLSIGCKRDVDPPRLDQGAEITFISPEDESNYATGATLEASAKVEGELKDYSFMQYYVLNADTYDTLARGDVEANGDVHASWQNNLAPGRHLIRIIAVNHKVTPIEVLATTHRAILICILPAVQFTTITKNDTSITVNWEKSVPNNFKAYELFITRTDTVKDRPPLPPGKPIAYITDINQTSFTYSDIYFYYAYQFVLRVISGDDCNTLSERKSIEAGTFIILPKETYSRLSTEIIFDRTRNKIYYQPSSGAYSQNLYVITPGTLQIERTIDVGAETKLLNMKEDGNALYLAHKTAVMNYELRTLNLNTFIFETNIPFTLPNAATVFAAMHNRIVFLKSVGVIGVHEWQTGTNSTLLTTSLPEVYTDNDGHIIVTSQSDSFYAYRFNNGAFELMAGKKLPAHPHVMNVFHVPGFYVIGGTLYDGSFTETAHLANNSYFMGISNDGQYVVTGDNTVLLSSDLSEVAKYGDGFGTRAWFSADNKTLYHLTEGSLNIKWNPPARLFVYPWQ